MSTILNHEIAEYVKKFPEQTLLVPVEEIVSIGSGDVIKHFMRIAIVKNNKVDACKILPAGDALSKRKITAAFGEKLTNGMLETDSTTELHYKSMLKLTATKSFYENDGWTKDGDGFVLCNQMIKREEIVPVQRTNLIPSIQIISKGVTLNFMADLSANLFSEKYLGQICLLHNAMSILSHKLPQSSESYSSLLCLIGPSGCRKTSVANAFFNPLGFSSHQSSFEDTRASVEDAFSKCKDSTLIVDDLCRDNRHQTEILERLLRLAGDKTTGAKKSAKTRRFRRPYTTLQRWSQVNSYQNFKILHSLGCLFLSWIVTR